MRMKQQKQDDVSWSLKGKETQFFSVAVYTKQDVERLLVEIKKAIATEIDDDLYCMMTVKHMKNNLNKKIDVLFGVKEWM